MKKVRTRLLLVLGLTLLSVYLSIPSWPGLHDSLPEGLKWVVPPRGVSLGLGLQGGIHMVMEVEEDRAVEIAVDRSARAMKDLLVDKGIEVTKAVRQEGVKIAIELGGSDKLDEAANLIRESFSSYAQVSKEGNTLVYELDSEGRARGGGDRHGHQSGPGNDSKPY